MNGRYVTNSSASANRSDKFAADKVNNYFKYVHSVRYISGMLIDPLSYIKVNMILSLDEAVYLPSLIDSLFEGIPT